MDTGKNAWICTVCGYVHEGDSPPEICPVCGAAKELFEQHSIETNGTDSVEESSTGWRCEVCSYTSDDKKLPEACPVCGSSAGSFQPVQSSHIARNGLRIVVVGAGIAGVSAAKAARETSPDARITLLSAENHPPYYRINLTRYLAGEITGENLSLHPKNWYEQNGIDLQLQKELLSIDFSKKQIGLSSKETLEYDRLILTTGSHPFVPGIVGAQKKNVTVLRTKSDADFILEQCKNVDRVVVIGGGVLGLEAAGAIAKTGSHVTLLEAAGWLMPRQLNEQAALFLERFVTESGGIKLVKNARTKEILGDQSVHGVQLEDGRTIPAQLVVIATGVRSNCYLPGIAGLDVKRGIVVDDCLQSSRSDVFAAGDVAEHRGVCYGIWAPAQFQGTIAGINAAGGEGRFMGVPPSNMLKVLGYDLYSIGKISGKDKNLSEIDKLIGDAYYCFRFENNRMVGAILMGRTELSASVKMAIEKEIDCSPVLPESADVKGVLDFLNELQGKM